MLLLLLWRLSSLALSSNQMEVLNSLGRILVLSKWKIFYSSHLPLPTTKRKSIHLRRIECYLLECRSNCCDNHNWDSIQSVHEVGGILQRYLLLLRHLDCIQWLAWQSSVGQFRMLFMDIRCPHPACQLINHTLSPSIFLLPLTLCPSIELGVKWNQVKVKAGFISLYSNAMPTMVNTSNPESMRKVVQFYETMEARVDDLGILGFFESLWSILVDGHFYVRKDSMYYSVQLADFPYFGVHYVPQDLPTP